MENYLVRGSAIDGFRSAITELGGDASELLRGAGLSEIEDDPEIWVSYLKFLLLLEKASEATDCPHFGLHLSQHQSANALGPMGFIIQQAADLRSALRDVGRYMVHHNQGAAVDLVVEDGVAQWRFHCKLQGYAPTWHQADLAAGIGVNLIQLLWNRAWTPNVVYLPHAAPADLRYYQAKFKSPIIFDWDCAMLVFDAAILDMPIHESNPELHRLLEHYLSSLQESYPNDFLGQLRHVINQALTTGDCSIERVASHFSMNKRTLQRQLKAHDSSYKDLLEETRFGITKRYLRESNGSLTALADMLGYADLSTFSTAFRKLHGVSPRGWKKQMAAL